MKKIKLVQGEGFTLLEDCGQLHYDFENTSLLSQLLPQLNSMSPAGMSRTEHTYLVFSTEEEELVLKLFRQITGQLVIDHGLGYQTSGEIKALRDILRDSGHCPTYVPTHFERDGRTPIAEIKEWSLAIE